MAATGGVAVVYLISIGARLFGHSVPYIHDSAATPKYMEWYAAFELLVTLVWLYLEILRLLSKVKKR